MNKKDLEDETENNSDLEKEFKALCDKAGSKIEEQLEIARQAIDKAQKLSEKYGVPFYSDITPLSMGYTPSSFDKKFRALDSEILYELTGAGVNDYDGWEHSAVC